MWAWWPAFLAYLRGRSAGVAQQKQVEQTATLDALKERADVEIVDAADTADARRERLSKWSRS